MSTSPQLLPTPHQSAPASLAERKSPVSRFQVPRSLLWVCALGLGLYLIPMLLGLLRGEPAGQRAGGWLAVPIMQKDSEQYVGMARDLSDFHLDELHIRTIGYPLLIWATGSSEQPQRGLYVAGLLLHAMTVLLLGALMRAAGLGLGWVLAFGSLMWLPIWVEPAAFVMTENASQFTLTLGLAGLVAGLSLQRPAWLAVGGAGLAWSALVHPTYQALSLFVIGVCVLLPVCCPWVRLRWPQIKRLGLMVFCTFLLFVGGVILMNRLLFGFFGLSPFAGYALSSKTVRVVEQLPDEFASVREVLVNARDTDLTTPGSSHMAASYMWRAKDQVSNLTGLEGAALSKYLVKLHLILIKEAPLSYLQEIFLATAALWAPTSGQGLANFGSGLFHALWAGLDLLIMIGFALTVVAMSGIALVARLGRLRAARSASLSPAQVRCRTLLYALGLSVVVYTTLVVGFFGPGITRYRAPLAPIVLVLTLVGAEQVWRLRRSV